MNQNRKNILIVSLSDLENDPRVNRQIRFLAEHSCVTAAGFSNPCVEGVNFIHIPTSPLTFMEKIRAVSLLKCRRFEDFYWSRNTIRYTSHVLEGKTFDLVVANDLIALPLACKVQSKHGVLFDAHEYSPREYEESFKWRFFYGRYNDYMCRTYIPRSADMLTVCESIASAYKANYGANPKVMTNAPPYHELAPSQSVTGLVRMIHHGGAVPSRNLELMIEAMDFLDERFHLDMMLVPSDPQYYSHLQSMAVRNPRVRFVSTVPMRELPRRLNEYDVGLYLLPPSNFNNQCALPNKFFEFIQARLAVAIGPSPEMARLVRRYDCGVVSADFSPQALAESLQGLDADNINRFKERAHLAAKDLCFERDAEVLLETINNLIGTS